MKPSSSFCGAARSEQAVSSVLTQSVDTVSLFFMGRCWRERLLGFGIALLAFSVYTATLCPCVFPGNSALAFANVLHTGLGREIAGHPLWTLSARLFSLLPFAEIPWRLNLFSALCGAGAVYFLFRLVTLLLYDVLSEERWMPETDGVNRSDVLPIDGIGGAADAIDTINERGHRMALAGGAVSALAFAFCAPFWHASTGLHFQTFELLLLLSAGYALSRYLATSSVPHLLVAVFLMGGGAIESVFMCVLLPLFWGLIIFAGRKHGHISVLFIGLLVSCFAAGALLAGIAQALWVIYGGASVHDVIKIAAIWAHGHVNGIRVMMTRKGWLLMLIQGILPLLIVYSGRYHFSYTHLLSPSMEDSLEYRGRDPEEHQARASKIFWGISLLILLGCVTHVLLNLPGSPWHLSRESAYLPVLPLLGIAMTLGFLFSYGAVIGYRYLLCSCKRDHKALSGTPSHMAGLVSAGISVATCALIGASLMRNSSEQEGRKAVFVDRFCREILATAPDAQCFVTDGTFDMNLSVQAKLQKREVTLLNIRERRHWRPSAVAGITGAKKQTTEAFLVEWLAVYPGACGQVAVLAAPRLWVAAGFQAVPGPLVYRGAKPDARLDFKALVNNQRSFWEKNKALFVGDAPRSLLLRHLQAEMRTHVSRVANDLGVLCLVQDARDEALAAFELALDLDPDNFCARVNHFTANPVNVELNPQQSAAWVDEINASLARCPSFGSLSDLEWRYGALYFPAVERLANLFNMMTDPHEPEQQRSPVLKLARDYVLAAIQTTTDPRLSKQVSIKDGVIDDEVLMVVKAITGGYSKAAESQLRNLLRKRRTSLVAWALLAEALMNQKNFSEVRETILPEMRFIAGDKGSEWIELTEGCLALRQDKPDYRLAHEHFMRVLKRNPDIEEAQELLIQAALLRGDEALIEADCNKVMNLSPCQPMANAALGAIRLNQGRLEEARKALNDSIASRPSSLALNDLGETLRRLRRLTEAETMTRRALLLTPSFYQAWDTLALILRDQGRLDEAAEAHRAALRICRSDIRLYLSAAELEEQRGDLDAARKLLEESAPVLAYSAPAYQATYKEIQRRLSAERPKN